MRFDIFPEKSNSEKISFSRVSSKTKKSDDMYMYVTWSNLTKRKFFPKGFGKNEYTVSNRFIQKTFLTLTCISLIIISDKENFKSAEQTNVRF